MVKNNTESQGENQINTKRKSHIIRFRDIINHKFKSILDWKNELQIKGELIEIKKAEKTLFKKIVAKLPEFLLDNPIICADDLGKLSDKITHENAMRIIEILREWNEKEFSPKVLKYLWDDWILKEEKKSFYVNRFSESFMNAENFYAIIPAYIKEVTTEKLFRFIGKQTTDKYEWIDNLDRYFRFLWEKINFPKIWIKLILDYFKNAWYISTEFDETNYTFKISLTKKWKNSRLWLKELLEINWDAEYSTIEWDLKKRITDMIMHNFQEWIHHVDSIKEELYNEWIMVKKNDLRELRQELLQLMASSSSSKSVIQQLNEEIEEEKKYEVCWWVYQFQRKEMQASWEYEVKTYSIPISEVDEIFKAYSKYWENLTQKKVEIKFKISKAVWSLLKSRLDLTKDSLPVSPFTLENFEWNPDWLRQFSDNLWDELIRDKFRNAIIDAYNKQKAKEFERLKRIVSNVDSFLEHMEWYLKWYRPRELWFDKIITSTQELRKEEYLSISFWDIHLGKANNEDVINRIKKMTQMAINYPQKNICLIWLWDWFETVVEWWMHSGQVEWMDWPYWFDLIMLFVKLMEDMIITLSKAWKEITFYSVWWNHDRLWKWHDQDAARTANLIVFELIKKWLSNLDVKIEAFRDRTSTFEFWHFHYIINHWEDGFSKKVKTRPEEVLWESGNQKLHNIIKFWHLHHWYLWETKNATIIWIPALAWPWEYDKRLWLFSETWVTIINENDEWLPDVAFRRVKWTVK